MLARSGELPGLYCTRTRNLQCAEMHLSAFQQFSLLYMDTEQRDAADPEMQGVGGQRTRGKRLVIQPKKVDMQSLSDPAHYHCNTGQSIYYLII